MSGHSPPPVAGLKPRPQCPSTTSLDPASGVLVLLLVLARVQPHQKADVAALARTCRRLCTPAGCVLATIASAPGATRLSGQDPTHAVALWTPNALDSLEKFVSRWANYAEVDPDDDEQAAHDDQERYHRSVSSPAMTRPLCVLHLRDLSISIHPSQLSRASSSGLVNVLSACALTLTHLHIAYAESVLALDDTHLRLAATQFPSLSHLVLSGVASCGCVFLKALQASLTEVEINFDDSWVSSVIRDSAIPHHPHTVLTLNGDVFALPSPTPGLAPVTILPDPLPLLAHSMHTLQTLRASNAIIVTVADKLRYPALRTLTLRLAGVPTVTPLVHAFPGVSDLYVYTPFDGCSFHFPLLSPSLPPSDDPPHASGPNGAASPRSSSLRRRKQADMPRLGATRDANRTSQTYSSFPPLARVRGFAPGLYALGLTCAVHHLEVGALTPGPAGGVVPGKNATATGKGKTRYSEARAVQSLLAETMPSRLGLGLGRGWWTGSGGARGKQRAKEREVLRTLFCGRASPDERVVHPGVSELVVRVQEPGRWKDVTDDLLAMITPLANTLTTFVLHWDRTSVPFDRTPSDEDDGVDDDADPVSGEHCQASSRAEAFARRIAQQMPVLRYIFASTLEDGDAGGALLSCEQRSWRVDRSEGWLCLDPLAEPEACKLMHAEGLSFDDGVRY